LQAAGFGGDGAQAVQIAEQAGIAGASGPHNDTYHRYTAGPVTGDR
jgi:hypothetical protein